MLSSSNLLRRRRPPHCSDCNLCNIEKSPQTCTCASGPHVTTFILMAKWQTNNKHNKTTNKQNTNHKQTKHRNGNLLAKRREGFARPKTGCATSRACAGHDTRTGAGRLCCNAHAMEIPTILLLQLVWLQQVSGNMTLPDSLPAMIAKLLEQTLSKTQCGDRPPSMVGPLIVWDMCRSA